jgi:hypothetical protein
MSLPVITTIGTFLNGEFGMGNGELEPGIWDLGFGIWDLESEIWDLGFGIWDFNSESSLILY